MIIITTTHNVQNMTPERPLLTFPRVIFWGCIFDTMDTGVQKLNKTIARQLPSAIALIHPSWDQDGGGGVRREERERHSV